MKRPVSSWSAAVAAALVLNACHRSPPAAGPDKFPELQRRVQALEGRLGPDSCLAPELEGIIQELEAIPETSPHFTEAVALAGTLKAQRRAGLQATDERDLPNPWKEAPRVPSFGPVQVEGEQPTGPDALARVEALRVGDSRQKLVDTLGACLVRQTWFKGQRGAPTVELFHIAPECRSRFKERVYRVVGAEAVDSITDGNLDGVMSSGASGLPEQ